MADDDEQDEAEIRRNRLKRLKERVDSQMVKLGLEEAPGYTMFSVWQPLAPMPRNPAAGISSEDVWTGPLADEQAEAAQREVDALTSCFTELQEGIAQALVRSAISGIS